MTNRMGWCRRAGAGPRGARDAGFTLLELLVSMALLALMFALVAAGLRFGARAWEGGTERMGRLSETTAVQRLIRQRLTAIYPLRPAERDGESLFFNGGGDGIEFATILPDHFGVGGFYEVMIGVSRRGEQTDLVFRHRLFGAEAGPTASRPADHSSLLLEDISGAKFSYYGAPTDEEEPRWHESWLDARALPQLIRIEIGLGEDDDRSWPPVVVAPMIDAL